MLFPPSFLEQVRNRITLSEIIGKQVRLTHRNGGSYGGLCPFHQEKTPSFTVSNDKGFYHCFGCGAHGDAFSFLMKKEGVSFSEAVTRLAEQAGVPLPQPDKRIVEKQHNATSAYAIMEQACRWFEQQLFSPAGKEARGYLQQRSLGREAAAKFRLGFSPNNRHALERYFTEKGISTAQLLEVGLIGKTDTGEHYDRFRGRIIFPIMDNKNRVIAFGGRIIREGNPKYLNSPETLLFKKSEVLYAEHLARKAAHEQGKIIVVEGYMDVIALHMAGIATAVAPLGTALTEQHLERLWRYAKEPVLCLDGDNAGKRAMMRAALLALPQLKAGFSLRFAELPSGEDPDEAIKKRGVLFMERLFASASPLSDTLWNYEYGKHPLSTPEQKAAFEQRMMGYAESIKHPQLQGYYRRYFASKIWETLKKFTSNTKENNSNISVIVPEEQNVIDGYECRLVAVILSYPILLTLETVKETFISIEFRRSGLDTLRTAILEWHDETIFAHGNLPSHMPVTKDFWQPLEKMGFADNIDYLCGSSHFVPNIALHNKEDILLLWHYVVYKHHLALMQEEYKAALAEMTEEAESRATEYYKQMLLLEKTIFEKEQLLLNKD